MCDTSGPNTGAILSLNAIGKQDTYLLENETKKSFFNYDPKRHSNFRKFHKSTIVNKPGNASSNWPFGESITVTLDPRNMGDLLSNMYISIELPAVTGSSTFNYSDQIGRHLIKQLTMRVDDLVIENYHADWGIIYDELYLDESEKRTKRYTINRNLAEGTSVPNGTSSANKDLAQKKSRVFIPIPLFFSRKYESDEYETNKPNRPYFPTCAIHKQKIQFVIDFYPQAFFTDESSTLSLSSFDIITEEITLESNERAYIKNNKQQFITDIVQKHPSLLIAAGVNETSLELVPKIPVKTLNWFLRNTTYEDESVARGSGFTDSTDNRKYHFHNRFNLSSNVLYELTNEFYNPPLSSAKIYVNGEDIPGFQDTDHKYYKYTVPLLSRLSRPMRNIYTYAFSMNPINVEPSGSLDFTSLKSNRTKLNIKMASGLSSDYNLHLYYVGYQTFSFENGIMTRAY
tara:strand:+ start:979 stop:2352 length:1374 start_codon:yes stop_codon:yes gene_type:complete